MEKKEKDMMKISRIIEIDSDGKVTLTKLSPIDGTLTDKTIQVIMDDFMKNYKTATMKLKVLDHYPKSDACNNPCLQVDALKGHVSAIMLAMSLDCPRSPDVLVQLAPSKKIIAMNDFEAGELEFYPLTKSFAVAFSDAEHAPNDSHIVCAIDGLSAKAILHPQSNSKEYTALFWNLMQSAVSTKTAAVNMELAAIAYDFQPPQSSTATRDAQQFRMNLVKAVNIKKIKKFDEVVLLKKRPKAEPSSKKAKTEAKWERLEWLDHDLDGNREKEILAHVVSACTNIVEVFESIRQLRIEVHAQNNHMYVDSIID